MEIDGTAALVTGAASGLGRCIAQRLAAAGVALSLVDRDGAGAERTLEELGAKGIAVAADLSRPEEVEAAVRETDERLGPLDILVNCAGIPGVGAPKPTAATTLEEWELTLAVNVTAPFLLCRLIVPGMVERGRGVVLNVASVAGLQCLPGRVSYTASKSALLGLTRTLAAECAKSGVRVNAVCPGWIETPFTAARLAQPELRAAAEAMIPMGRVATPDEIADTAVFLLSPAARYVTGAALVADGGVTLI
jgi:3-oxoacyl-[acyl-carrier protein] reductase